MTLTRPYRPLFFAPAKAGATFLRFGCLPRLSPPASLAAEETATAVDPGKRERDSRRREEALVGRHLRNGGWAVGRCGESWVTLQGRHHPVGER